MEIIDEKKKDYQNDEKNYYAEWEHTHRRGRIIGGFLFFLAGSLFLLREFGFAIPNWVFTWKMLLIAIGVFVGIKHKFRNFSWLVLILVGSAFLIQDFMPSLAIGKFIWPLIIMAIGLKMILRPKHRFNKEQYRWKYRSPQWKEGYQYLNEKKKSGDSLELNVVMGAIKKSVITKEFGGGEINCVLGGSEVDFMNADFEGEVRLEVNLVMGAVTLLIPNSWLIKSEIVSVMGSVEDRRNIVHDYKSNSSKVLILSGNAVMGGIEIKSI
jgi:predicted membrane protein